MALLGVLVAVASLGSSCNVPPSAASVNGAEISQATLVGDLSTLSSSEFAQCALELQGTQFPAIAGSASDSVTSGFAAGELSSIIEQDLISQELARLHVRVTGADLQAARADLVAELYPPSPAEASPCGLEGPQLFARLPASFVAEQVRFQADAELLLSRLAHVSVGPRGILRYYFAHPSQFQEDCLSAIVVPTEAEAAAIRSKVASGAESFAAAARAHSLDATSRAQGGAIGCPLVSEITNPSLTSVLASLKVGQVSQPLSESAGGSSTEWVLLQVTSRPEQPLSAVAGEIRREILATHGSALQSEIVHLFETAHVQVNPLYGHWSPSAGVVPASAPPSKFLLPAQ